MSLSEGVGTVSALWRYPVKSMLGEELDTADLSEGGVVGAAIGLALGILLSLTTDVPLAPEAGLVIGLVVGWLSRRMSA